MGRSRRSRAGDRGQRDQRELVWRRIDLHIHTPASADYQDPDVSFLDILRRAEARGADLIAFTDHNSVRGYANFWREIEDLELLEALERLNPSEERRLDDYRRMLKKIRVLPGFELTTTFGFHVLAIFEEGTSIRQLEHLLLELNVPEDKIDLGSGEVGATTDVLNAYEVLHDAGALVVPAHVNSTHGVAMQNLPFGGQTKIAFTQSPYIDALEATDLESASRRGTARFFNGSKPEYPRRMHIIQGSDAHRLNRDPNRESNLGVGDRMTEVQIPELTFAALRDLFRSEHFNRVRPYRPSQDPYDFVRLARSEGDTIVQAFHPAPPARRGRQSPIIRDIAAFANGNGGTIFVGLSAALTDPIAGVDDAPGVARGIAEDIARYVTPPIAGSIDISASGDKQIIVISIPAGDEKPYAVLPSAIYVRQEGETTLALRDEIVQLVRAGIAGAPGRKPELVAETPAPIAHAPAPARARARTVAPLPAPELIAEPEAPAVAAGRPARPSRRRRASPRAAVETPTAETLPVTEEAPPIAPVEDALPDDTDERDVASADIPYPRTGVEIVRSVERDGVIYHSMRDLRNLKVVHNVTRDSARRLWRYAITQQETHALTPEDVSWDGERGFWKAYKQRGGDVRFNLAYRHNGDMHVFFGVTDEGMDDAWRSVVPERARPKPAPEPVEAAASDDAAE
ncbi:MAG TPA: RNA-binding domain-containing protein [Thermomicrobiales bacterium]|nr:RNA-binding domain-containing protein [Thermomicrobiales bacterium]